MDFLAEDIPVAICCAIIFGPTTCDKSPPKKTIMKFLIGDLVKCILSDDTDGVLTKGYIYKVIEIVGEVGETIEVSYHGELLGDAMTDRYYWSTARFILHKRPQ